MVEVDITPLAERQRKGLRSKHATAFARWLDELKHQGCRALGYRLTGQVVEHLCVRHLSGALRVVVGFHAADHATIVLIGPHDDTDPGLDVYTRLYALAGLQAPPAEQRTKPPCCDDAGLPPTRDDVVDQLVDRASDLVRQRRNPR
ncbi:hypothetical protein GCM10009854_01070 [Saccharopolyspora halophila]|uniref:Uncharacterized protein n=1 Tax=Saccharopolyspora halophila TaxID=405551 RepID=A0ABN3FHE6_9PSEU